MNLDHWSTWVFISVLAGIITKIVWHPLSSLFSKPVNRTEYYRQLNQANEPNGSFPRISNLSLFLDVMEEVGKKPYTSSHYQSLKTSSDEIYDLIRNRSLSHEERDWVKSRLQRIKLFAANNGNSIAQSHADSIIRLIKRQEQGLF